MRNEVLWSVMGAVVYAVPMTALAFMSPCASCAVVAATTVGGDSTIAYVTVGVVVTLFALHGAAWGFRLARGYNKTRR